MSQREYGSHIAVNLLELNMVIVKYAGVMCIALA